VVTESRHPTSGALLRFLIHSRQPAIGAECVCFDGEIVGKEEVDGQVERLEDESGGGSASWY